VLRRLPGKVIGKGPPAGQSRSLSLISENAPKRKKNVQPPASSASPGAGSQPPSYIGGIAHLQMTTDQQRPWKVHPGYFMKNPDCGLSQRKRKKNLSGAASCGMRISAFDFLLQLPDFRFPLGMLLQIFLQPVLSFLTVPVLGFGSAVRVTGVYAIDIFRWIIAEKNPDLISYTLVPRINGACNHVSSCLTVVWLLQRSECGAGLHG